MVKRSKKTNRKKNPMQTAFTRFMLIVAFLCLDWRIGVRLVHLQVSKRMAARQGAKPAARPDKNKMLRGTIFDRSDALCNERQNKSLFADRLKRRCRSDGE